MLIVFIFFLIIASVIVLFVKRNKETFYLFAMCISLAFMLIGTLIYIAKKGGISKELQNFFFINSYIKIKAQYLLIRLERLGFIIALGRYLFPMFLLLLALHYSMNHWIRRTFWLRIIAVILPIGTLIIYYPPIFHYLAEKFIGFQIFIIDFSLAWIVVFVLASIALFLYEAFSINLKIFRRPFVLITIFILSLTTLYLLYVEQDPAQVYYFYMIDSKGRIFYLQSIVSIPIYMTIVSINVIAAIIGFASLLRYTQETFKLTKEGEIIKYQTEAVNMTTSTFVHGIKNQLLANRVIHKRINRLNHNESEQIRQYLQQLDEQNENILNRIDELYNTIKTSQVHLVPNHINDIVEQTTHDIREKYKDSPVAFTIETDAGSVVLADRKHLIEAINNLIINAFEAIEPLQEEGVVILRSYSVRLYHVIEVSDNGLGMSKDEMKQIEEPFYTNKNSNYNWGVGLYYVRSIIKEHYGNLRYESERGKGSTFYLLLPKYREARKENE